MGGHAGTGHTNIADGEPSRDLRKIVERLETEIEGRIEDLEGIGSALFDLSSELDNQIAEHDYMAAEQSAYTFLGLADAAEVLPLIDSALLLTALRDGTSAPNLTLPPWLIERDSNGRSGHPRLTQEDLDRQFEVEKAQAEQLWLSTDSDETSDPEDSGIVREELWRAEQEAIRNRAHTAGLHLIKLVDHVADNLWPTIVEAVQASDRAAALGALADADAAARDAIPAYKLYEANLARQYEADPSSLGAMGEFVQGFETWLHAQKHK